MALFESRHSADGMADLLSREREAILTGRFDVLERLVAEKERLTARLARAEIGTDDLRELKAMAARNETLLAAARSGLERAGAKVRALGEPLPELHTYDASGSRTAMKDGARRKDRLR